MNESGRRLCVLAAARAPARPDRARIWRAQAVVVRRAEAVERAAVRHEDGVGRVVRARERNVEVAKQEEVRWRR